MGRCMYLWVCLVAVFMPIGLCVWVYMGGCIVRECRLYMWVGVYVPTDVRIGL